jgi:hypothetical protein
VDYLDTKPTQVFTHYCVKDESENYIIGVVWAASEQAAIDEVRTLTGYEGALMAEGTGLIQLGYLTNKE